ncbi:MAG: response regulator transcription factor [Anaerolineae bacterium]|nr:response regulator transcription factor [Anaerolineae bacterium]
MTTEQISVLICDDQAVVREGLAAILSTVPQIKVVGLAGHGQEVLELIAQQQPDVVLMDLNMPVMNGVQATRRIREQFPQVAVLVLTTHATDEWLFDAIRAGAAGYLLKDTRRDDLVRAIEGTARGQTHLDPDVAGKLMVHVAQASETQPPTELPEPLTPREEEVLRLLAQGLSNPEIAERLNLSAGTVRNYVSEAFAKLGVSDRAQAAIMAVKLRLI